MFAAPNTIKAGLREFVQKFLVLRHAPRELWIVLAAYILENLAYKLSSSQVLPGWLNIEMGLGDEAKGTVIGIWSALVTLCTVLVGSFTDVMGIRKTFLTGFAICIFARLVMLLANIPWLALAAGLLPLALGLALMTPVMAAAMRRYSTPAQRSVAFSLYYALMNLGFAIGARLFDHLRHTLGERGTWLMPGTQMEVGTYRVMILWSVGFTVLGALLIWLFLRDGVEMTETGVRIEPAKSGNPNAARPFKTAIVMFGGLWRQPMFFRFLLFMLLVVGVKMIFFYVDYVVPDFAKREISLEAPFARVTAMLNSLLILLFAPLCGVLMQRVPAYRAITIGSLISAGSVFFLAIPPAQLQSLADGWLGDWIGHHWLGIVGPVHPLYIALFLFTVGLSIGEALWSPRLYEYAAAIAPKGREASYMAMTSLPYFFAKCGAGFLSGWLLTHFCPETGERHPQTMWMIIGLMALATPASAIMFRKYIQVHEAGR